MMRIAIVAVALALAACGQGGPLGAASGGWQVQEIRDELTGTATQTAMLVSPFDNGHVELTATCAGEQTLEDRSRYSHNEMDLLAAVLSAEGGGPSPQMVEFRMIFIGASDDQSFLLASDGAALGLQSTIELRASTQDGQEERLVGFVDHTNSVTMQVPVAAFFGSDAISALRVEIPLLLQSATSGQPPLSQNVVVDLLPQDENLRTLLNACDPSASQAAGNTSTPLPAPAPQSTTPVFAEVPFDAVGDGASCVAVDADGRSIFVTDFQTGVINANGEVLRLSLRGGGDVGWSGGDFLDASGNVVVRITLTGEPIEVGHENAVTPADLTFSPNVTETVVPVTYQCGG